MDELRVKQIETLGELYQYDKKLVPALHELIEELRGELHEDTLEYLNKLMDGVNWNIEVFNLTQEFINEKESNIDKDEFDEVIQDLNLAIQSMDMLEVAAVLEMGVLPLIEELNVCIPKLVDIKEN